VDDLINAAALDFQLNEPLSSCVGYFNEDVYGFYGDEYLGLIDPPALSASISCYPPLALVLGPLHAHH
jgi:hypothetical protein